MENPTLSQAKLLNVSHNFSTTTTDIPLERPQSPKTPKTPSAQSQHQNHRLNQVVEKIPSTLDRSPLGKPIDHINVILAQWWWWEIGASVLSIVGILLVGLVLYRIDSNTLQNWLYSIQPNSLISVLTTVSKASMMVPIASSISQLKWQHFSYRPNTLNNLQLFDDASRGPWGSLTALLMVRPRAITLWALSIVTLVALGIEPSAQQILQVSTRPAALSNVTATIPSAQNYYSHAWTRSTADLNNIALIKAQNAIMNGAVGILPQMNYSCGGPATGCTWDEYTTLGVCSEFKNVTNDIPKQCFVNETSDKPSYTTTCSYNFSAVHDATYLTLESGMPPSENNVLNLTWSLPDLETNENKLYYMMATGSLSLPLYLSSWAGLDIIKYRPPNDDTLSIDVTDYVTNPLTRDAEAYTIQWYWCAQTYKNVTATPIGIISAKKTEEKLFNMSPDGDPTGNGVYRMNSTGMVFNISGDVENQLFNFVASTFTTNLTDLMSHFSGSGGVDLGRFLYNTDLSVFAKNVADTLSLGIRNPADNMNTTMVVGKASCIETFYDVRWVWLSLPIAETILTAALLTLTIVQTREQPLFKTSLIALLIYGLDGWKESEFSSARPMSGPELENLADRMQVKLGNNAAGDLRLIRTDSTTRD
ncbi:uncharacterized protein F4822DRAFT_428216 [Hypoxylon trugodes]|uniref:uncharacterized protein n=1 Tax=Hypoxylon trugodes TaxID=326681 RepID=UPI00218FD2D0|nr:uncharacterized protein F4822DRAFT_428216 [Hypoxylon trugodes]KAI1389875.1 hypothetical protein F4822DRAFT_428216 [Hypoxylon trugodes]